MQKEEKNECKQYEHGDCNTDAPTYKNNIQHKCTVYPVTPPEGRALELPEFWDMLFLKREKLYKRFLGGKQRSHTHPSQQEQQQHVCFKPSSVELRLWFCLVSIYRNWSGQRIYIHCGMQGVPSTHKTGTVTVVNLKREKGKPTGFKKDGSVRMAYLNTLNRKLPNRDPWVALTL